MQVKQIESLLMDYVTDHSDFAGSYLHSTVKAVRSWLSANDVELRHKIKVRGRGCTGGLPCGVRELSDPNTRILWVPDAIYAIVLLRESVS